MKRNILIGILLMVAVGIVVSFTTKTTSNLFGNASRFQVATTCATSAASSTLKYLFTASATTTITCKVADLGAGTEALNSAILLLQLQASSTPGTIASWWYEYSYDGVDYYPAIDKISLNATTTGVTAFPVQYILNPGASSTMSYDNSQDGTGYHTASFDVPTPTPYIRVVIFKPYNSSFGFGVYGKLVGKSEQLH